MERTEESAEKTGPKGNWYVVTGIAGRYIVRSLKSPEEVRQIHQEGGVLDIEEAFEFTSQIQVNQVPNPHNPREAMMNVGKVNLAHRLDATLFPVQASLSLMGALVYSLDKLTDPDAATYKENIRGAVSMADSWYQERVRSKSGVELVTMPKGGLAGLPLQPIKR